MCALDALEYLLSLVVVVAVDVAVFVALTPVHAQFDPPTRPWYAFSHRVLSPLRCVHLGAVAVIWISLVHTYRRPGRSHLARADSLYKCCA